MGHARVVAIAKKYAEAVKEKMPVKLVILQNTYPKYEDLPDEDIEVAVVLDTLHKDMLEARDDLLEIARRVDSRIEPLIIEAEKNDTTGFFNEIKKKGEIVLQV